MPFDPTRFEFPIAQIMIGIDISEVLALEKRAEKELDRVLPIMRGAVAVRVALEKSTHVYNNITGNLEKSTISFDSSDPRDNHIEVHAEMGMSYASNVDERGRTNFRALMKAADRNIAGRLNRMAEGLSKK